jgi:GAF domain-containing protein
VPVTLSYDTALELAQLAGLVLSEPDVDAALTRVTQVAVRVVPDCAGASLTMRNAGVPSAPAASDPWALSLDELQFAEQEGPCLNCLREGSVMRSRDLAADERFPSYGPRAAERGARSALSLPLAADGRTVGALNLYSRDVDAFDREALAVGELLAAHAALASRRPSRTTPRATSPSRCAAPCRHGRASSRPRACSSRRCTSSPRPPSSSWWRCPSGRTASCATSRPRSWS